MLFAALFAALAATRVPAVDTNAMAVCLDGTTLYCLAGESLHALDVSEPLKPRPLGRLDGMDNRRQLVVRDGFAYVVSRETGLRIVDVRDPKAMRIRSRYDSVEFATGLEVVGKTVFLSERINGVEAVDVSDPDRPVHVAIRKTHESQSCRYRDGYLYSGEWGVGQVTVFDVHDLADFRQVRTVDLGGFGDGVEIDGNYLYCSTGHDARNWRATKRREAALDRTAAASPTAGNPERDVGAGRGLEIFDLSDPAFPRRVSRVDFPVFKPRNEDFWTPRVANGLAFCCDSHNGLFVVDVKDPKAPKVIDRFCVPQPDKPDWPSGAISSAAIGDGCVYVTSFPGGLWVLKVPGVKPPARPQGVLPRHPDYREAYPTDAAAFYVYRPAAAGQARSVALRGDVAYCAFGDAGLHVVRVCPDGAGFEKLGELPGAHRVTDCCFVGDRLMTAEGLDGFALYELDGASTFREVARRGSLARGVSVAFWCWPFDERYVILSGRNGGYWQTDARAFSDGETFGHFGGSCQWDRYLPERALAGRMPVLIPYNGLLWLDAAKGRPAVVSRERKGTRTGPCGSQCNGIGLFDANRFIYTMGSDYQFLSADGTRSPIRAFPPVPAFEKKNGPRFGGIPRSDGRTVVCTARSSRRVVVWDFADVEAPKLVCAYQLSGHPDQAALCRGRALIPAGHQGLLLEKRAGLSK